MSKKKIIAIVTVIVLLLAAGISVGVFLHNRGESEAADGSQVVDGNLPTDGTQTGENDENPTTNPDAGNENDGEAGDNETVDNDNENAGNETANNNNAGNAGITTDTNVNDVGETTITRVEEQDRLVSEHFLDWWKPMLVKVNQKTALCVNEPELTVEKLAITGVGGDEFVYTGQNITYVIEVTNNSNKTINNIEIKDKIPQGTSFVSIEDVTIEDKSVAEGTTIGEANSEIGVKWVVTIPSGKTAKAKFTVKVTATEGTISNVAIANGKESTDPTKDPTDPDNETKTSIIKANKSSVITRDGKEVEIAKIGDLITYTITVENTGDAKGTTYITDKVPTGTEFVSTPENEGAIVSEAKDSIAWSITLGANETVTKTFVVKVKEVINGTIVNIANVGGTETEPDNVKVEAYIVFVENGGTEVDDITGVAGEKIENTAMPKTTRHGYVFEGWYAEEELTTKVDKLPETYPAGTTTYYAKWSPVTGLKGIVNYYLKDTTTKLADCKPLTGLTFDTEITETAINIDGYNKVDPTSVTIKVGLEGNEINFYYTPRTDLEGIVNYYLKDTTTKLADSKPLTGLVFNSSVSENAIEIAGYNKVEPTSVTIKVGLEENEINFYYTPRTDIEGIVNYYLKDTTTKLADSKPLTGLVYNSEITETAIEIAGYNKVDPTSVKITVGLEENEINFYYTPRTDLTGVVNYYLKDTTTKLADSKPLTGLTFNSEIEEKAIDIPGYNKVEPTSVTIKVGLEGNEINFYYTPRTDLTGVVNYYLKDTTTKLADSKELKGLEFNSEITENAIEIAGYNKVDPTSVTIKVALEGNEINFYYTPRTDLTGVVNYYLKDTTTKLADSKPLTGLTFNSEIEEKAIDIPGYNKVDPTSAKITVALEGNEINFYYTPRTDLTGIVNYYLKDTTTKLADSKELTGLTFNSEITEKAIDIPGYDKVDPTSAKITVALEGNEINFYYTFGKSQYTVEYYYEINGNYPSKTELNDVREGTTLSTVAVTADDKTPTLDGYIFDAEYTGNVLDGTVTPDGSLVLKVYFKQQLKVVYTKGSQGTFENQEYTVKYGDIPTTFNGTPTGNAGFHFVGWDKDVTKQVTENVTFIAIWEGLQVRKTRLEIIDKDNLGNTDYVDQDGDIIRYEITVKNIGDIKAENIVLKDSLAIKVVSVEIAGTEVEIANRGSNEFAANADLLQGLTAGIEPNETIVVTVEHTVTDSEVKAALANDSKIINIATAELNDNPYTGTDKTVDPEDGTEEEGTEVKQRCEYRVEYHYNGQLGTADDDVIESAAIVGATISFEKPVERKGFTYMNYVGSTTVTEGTNLIIVNYGKPVVAISKAASATVDAGANIEYTLTVTNTGLVGTTVTVSDELVGTTYVPGSANIGEPTIINNVLTWQVTVGAQSTKTITFKAATPKTAFGQTITNTAHIKNGETIIGSSNEVSTTVNEITVKYTEWKEGQQGTDLNIIFLLDNSASMNEPIAGEENEYSNDNSYYVAPTDVTKTRLYNAKEAIKGFITNQSSNPNTSMSVITFNSDYADTIDRYVLVKNEDIKTKTENGKTIRYTTINGIDYEVSDADDTITATDGNDYCYVTITINEGPVLVGTNSTSNADLTAAVNNITIGSRREGLGTSIAPAIDKITENSSTYLNSAKKNIVIVLADGDFDNPQNDSWLYGRGYVSAKNDLLAKDSNLEIYSVGFGNYVESTMRKVSTNDTCYPATNSSTILNKFNEILDEATGSEQTGTTSDGRITFNEATQTIKVSETCPIVATYETGAVDGEGNPIVETLFTCTSTADLATYGLTITGEKTISWDVKTFIANNPTAIVPNTVSIKYYIPITTSTN